MKIKLLIALILFCRFVSAEKPFVEWAKSAGGSSDDLSQSVAVDANHNVYVAGNFSSASIKFGDFTLTNSNVGSAHVFVAKYDSLGNVLWAKSSENNESGYAISVSADPDGNVIVCGFFKTSTITFGLFKINNNAPELYGKIFLVKYDALGNVLWAQSSSNTLWSNAMYSVCADKFGNIYATGHFQDSSITFGSITLNNTSTEYQDVFIVKYNSVGTVLWVR